MSLGVTALRCFGAFNGSRMKSLRISVYGFLLLLFLGASAVLGLHFYGELALGPKVLDAQSRFHSYEKLILADLRTLKKFPVFLKNEYKSDASELLSNILESENKSNRIVDRLFRSYPNWITDKIHFNRPDRRP